MKYKAALVFSILYLFQANWVLAQKENNIWYFGENAGLDFNYGAPIPLNDGALNSIESCASIADKNGDLLFYSDGLKVWNKKHQQMPNGFGLLSSQSATQGTLIVPKPGSDAFYYIFTVDGLENRLQNGLRYSIVALNSDNGFGDLIQKNILLETPVAEKLVAVRHANQKDYWIIVHKWNSNGFSAYLLDEFGVHTNPVESYLGTIHQGLINSNALGQMKTSQDGKKIALALSDLGIFELFDFNNATGELRNVKTTAPAYKRAYGVAFSPSGSKLYCTAGGYADIYQFNLLATDIFASEKLIGKSLIYGGGGLQLAPDKKIYFASFYSAFLGVINNPDELGEDCNYENDGVYLNGKFSLSGLPNFASDYFNDSSNIRHLKIPNIITPNNDSFNDLFVLKGIVPSFYSLQIFNRWGSLVYKTESYQNDWDARDNSAGTYYYLLRNSKTGQTFKGWLEVIK